MANKPALFGASQSSSFGHLRPPPQTSVTTTPNRAPLHNPLHANTVLCGTQQRTRIVPNCTKLYQAMKRFNAGLHCYSAEGHLTKLLTHGILLV